MSAFVTGGTGFIGKQLVRRLLERDGEPVYVLVCRPTPELIAGLKEFWGEGADRVTLIEGDISKPDLGVAAEDARKLEGKIDHFFHLAAVYDLTADPAQVISANVAGVANALAFAKSVKAGCFHHVSSIAAAGLYDGVFREDMFEEARGLEHPYFSSKHKGEGLVRAETEIPWRIYRPGVVVGDSKTGEIDKIDGPYYFFKLIQKLREAVPSWVPMIGIEGGRINVVPVDFVVAAMDRLAHLDGLDGRTFHLTDPSPLRVGDMLNVLANAAHAPAFTVKVNAGLFGLAPPALTRGLMQLTPFRRMRKMMMKEFGLPDDVFMFVNYPTRFDSRETQKLLRPAGITVPPFEDYAWRLWDYWERHLDPALFVDRSLRGAVAGKRVLVTGGSAGIGKAIALRLAQAGANTLIVARDQEKLNLAREEFSVAGPRARDLQRRHFRPRAMRGVHSADLQRTRRHRHSRQQRRALDSPRGREFLRPPARPRTADAAELLRGGSADDGIPARHDGAALRAHRQHLLDQRADDCAALLGLCRLEVRAGGVVRLRGERVSRSQRGFHQRQHAHRAHRDDRADEVL